MITIENHTLFKNESIQDALRKLDALDGGNRKTLFILDKNKRLVGAVSDGDIRRGLLQGATIQNEIGEIMNTDFWSLKKGDYDLGKVNAMRKNEITLVPLLDKNDNLIRIFDLSVQHSILPVDAVIMAGGRGSRLSPLTDNTPKTLLNVGDKPIIRHIMDRLCLYGIDDFWVTLKYLGNQIENYFSGNNHNGVTVNFAWENEPLGTIGAVSTIKNFRHDHVIITNSDIITNIDYEKFFLDFVERKADLSIASVPYQVKIPYAVIETSDGRVINLKEKPTHTYYSNGGIYLVKKELLALIPENTFFNATDFIELLLKKGLNVISYPVSNYWLDVGNHDDYSKAQLDIKQIEW